MTRPDKEAAIKLRLQGHSYNQITKVLNVPKSTLSDWLMRVQLSDKAAQKIKFRTREGALRGLLKRNVNQTRLAEFRARSIRSRYAGEITDLSERELLIAGVALYWGEGYKRPIIKNGKSRTHHPVSLSNSDPMLIRCFLKFLRQVCRVDENKISANLRIYQHQNAEMLLNFWIKITNIPKERFQKFYYGVSKSSLGKRPFNTLPYGTIQIRVNNTNLYHQIMGWLTGLSNV